MPEDLEALLRIARQAVAAGAAVHRAARGRRVDAGTKHSSMDLVTAVDREAERAVMAVLRGARPEDALVGEEGTAHEGASGVRWILDPLDGTTNFVHGYPAHAVALGAEIDGRRALGVVEDTARDRVHSGIVGRGADCNGVPLAVSATSTLSEALIGTGFLPDPAIRDRQGDLLRRLLPAVRDVRRSGCPALDLCAVASGTLDGYYEHGLAPWDVAAGAAIAEAAGAVALELSSSLLPSPCCVVANPHLSPVLVAWLLEHGAAAPRYRITLAEPHEVAQLPEIERRASDLFLQHPATVDLPAYLTDLATFERAQRQDLLWVARLDQGRPVGFALAEDAGSALHLEELDVLPEHGRRGLGAALVEAVCRRAAADGARPVTLCTFRDVPWNAPFYERLGFRALGPDELTPFLQQRLAHEAQRGLTRELRVAMQRDSR